jgi:hypothetical protein
MNRISKITALASAVAILSLGLVACGSSEGGSINWNARGDSFAAQNDTNYQPAPLPGAASDAAGWCGGAALNGDAWVNKQLPPNGQAAEFGQWLQGCIAGYNQSPPGTNVTLPAAPQDITTTPPPPPGTNVTLPADPQDITTTAPPPPPPVKPLTFTCNGIGDITITASDSGSLPVQPAKGWLVTVTEYVPAGNNPNPGDPVSDAQYAAEKITASIIIPPVTSVPTYVHLSMESPSSTPTTTCTAVPTS